MTTPPPMRKLPNAPANQQNAEKLVLKPIPDNIQGHRIIGYGPGGIGKSTLFCKLPGPIGFVDADESLSKLKKQLVKNGIDLPMLIPATDFQSLRDNLHKNVTGLKSIVLDTGTVIEGLWCMNWVLKNIKCEGGQTASRIEDYGFGKGYRNIYDTFNLLLSDLDVIARRGINVAMVCHDDTKTVPNPAGQDFLRWEPKLQDSKGCSIRSRCKEWADHLLYFGYDVEVQAHATDKKKVKVGRAIGSGTRTLYAAEAPHFMAKSRTTDEQFVIELDGESPWEKIII
jgi:hypothetical protein